MQVRDSSVRSLVVVRYTTERLKPLGTDSIRTIGALLLTSPTAWNKAMKPLTVLWLVAFARAIPQRQLR